MIRVYDATMLALTKLRTRKVRLAITIIVSGLLFSGLAGASFIIRGAINGVTDFNREGLGNRYITQEYGQASFTFTSDETVLNRAVAIQKDLVARKKAAAKDLDIPYDPSTEMPAVQEFDTGGGGKARSLNFSTPAGRQTIAEYEAAHPVPGQTDLDHIAKPYKPKAFYVSRQLPYDLGGTRLQVLKNGQESFDQQQGGKGMFGPTSGTDSFVSSWSVMSTDLLKPFILPGQNLAQGADGSAPIIVPRSAAEQLLQLKQLPASASAKARLDRTKEIRAKAPSVRFSVCYRNSTSASLLDQAIATKAEMDKNKNTKDYQKPSLVYGLPTEPCGAVPIIRDVRTYDEKILAQHQTQFNQMFGEEAPQQQTVSFRIVGIVPDIDSSTGAIGVGQIMRSLVTSSLGSNWYMPIDQLSINPLFAKLFTISVATGGAPTYYTEFKTAADAKRFIEKENCDLDYSHFGPNQDPLAYCLAKNKPFTVTAYGNNSLALESASRTFAKFFKLAALAVSVIAAVIMMGTVGRMIADSRRETAVFRAIGAKKLDIAQIYIIYAICLSLLIAGFALTIGFVGASLANHHYSSDLTVQAINAFNATNLNKTFTLYAFYWPDILLLVGLSVTAGLLSAAFPLLRNLRRNPIRDMRDDT